MCAMTTLAIVLTGGRSSRMGGTHKPALRVAGETIIDHVVRAVRRAEPSAAVIVAGSAEGLTTEATVVSEDPPFSGPLAGVAAALAAVPTSPQRRVLILGGDMPFIGPRVIHRLLEALATGSDAASACDSSRRLQFLCAAWSEGALRARLGALGEVNGVRFGALYDGVDPVLIDADVTEIADIDTPEDFAWARAAIGDGNRDTRNTAPRIH